MHIHNKKKQVSIVGLGYIGLPTAVLVAQYNYQVHGFDVDREKIARINMADAPIQEPGLSEQLARVIADGSFKAYDELLPADYFLVAVPTPFKEGKKADLAYVFNAGTMIARVLTPGALVILESTVPVGTTRRFAQLLEDISGLRQGHDFFVAHCPERILPNNLFYELIHNDRIIGGLDEQSTLLAKDFYQPFVKGALHLTNDRAAEMIKLAENSSRDIQIAFANQLADMCEQTNIDVHEVINLANKHPRVHILKPGCGVGGHCIAVDPWFLIETFPNYTTLLKTARTINDARPYQVVEKIIEMVQIFRSTHSKKLKPKVVLFGLTYKPNTDDIRCSPAMLIAQELMQKEEVLEVFSCDPNLTQTVLACNGLRTVTIQEGVAIAHIVVFLIAHEAFTHIQPADLTNKQVLDTCGLLPRIQANHHSQTHYPHKNVCEIIL